MQALLLIGNNIDKSLPIHLWQAMLCGKNDYSQMKLTANIWVIENTIYRIGWLGTTLKQLLNFVSQRMIRKPVKIATFILALYLGLAYFAVNPLAKRVLPWVGEHKLASQLTVEQVKFDPLRLILTIRGLHLSQRNGAPLASFDKLYLNVETSGVLHFAWRLKDIRLTGPRATLEVAPDGKLNWAALIAKLNEDKQPDDSSMPRVIIDHILVERGNIQYADRSRETPFKAVLKPLGVELDGLSTLPEDRGEYAIVAKLPEQGGTLKWKGDLGLNPIASSGAIHVQGIKLAKLAQIVDAQTLPVTLTQGELETSLNYNFAMKGEPEPKPQLALKYLIVQLSNVAGTLTNKQGVPAELGLQSVKLTAPTLDFSMQQGTQLTANDVNLTVAQIALTQAKSDLFKLAELNINHVDFDLVKNQLKIEEVLLKQGALSAKRTKDGQINWQQLASDLSKHESTAEKPATLPASQATALETKSVASPFKFEIGRLQLEHWQADYQDQYFTHPLTAAVKDINLGFAISNAENSIHIQQLNSQIAGLTLQSTLYPKPVASLAKVDLRDSEIDLGGQTAKIGAITLNALDSSVIREGNKPLNWLAILEQADSSTADKAQQPATKPSAPEWKWSVDKIALENSSLHFEDNTAATPVLLDIQSVAAELGKSTQDLSKSVATKASFKVKQGGEFNATGKLTLLPLQADLLLNLDKLSLKPFSPLVNQAARLKLTEGTASVNGKLAIRPGADKKAQSTSFNGGFNVQNLAISEEETGAVFLNWKSVSSDTLKVALAPNQLHLDELRIEEPVSKFIIFEDKTLNIQRILRTPQPADKPSASASTASPNSSQEPFPVSVERLRIYNAQLEFADLSLKPQFGTHINTLSGVINGLSTNPATTAQVELDGKVDEFGSARIRGSVQPFKATEFTDLKLEFRNLEMNRLTPYSGKFAGRKIDSGKLSVDLEYKIKQRQLAGQNKFILNKLRLGERVDSPDAMSLPLDLAIALLEDSDGIIDLDLPVSGSLDDPQFSYGKVVWKAIVNVLGKIVTSPFRALGNLLGISSDKLEAIEFDAGSATLAPHEQEKLGNITTAISKRPSLKLNITPSYDPVADKVALQELATRRDVAKEMGLKLASNEQPGPINLNNPKVQSAIEALAKERSGGGRDLKVVSKLKDYFKKSKPEDVPKYAEMLEQLKLTVEVPETELQSLAKARVASIQNYLAEHTDKGATSTGANLGDAVKVTGDGKTVNVKMDLTVAKK